MGDPKNRILTSSPVFLVALDTPVNIDHSALTIQNTFQVVFKGKCSAEALSVAQNLLVRLK